MRFAHTWHNLIFIENIIRLIALHFRDSSQHLLLRPRNHTGKYHSFGSLPFLQKRLPSPLSQNTDESCTSTMFIVYIDKVVSCLVSFVNLFIKFL